MNSAVLGKARILDIEVVLDLQDGVPGSALAADLQAAVDDVSAALAAAVPLSAPTSATVAAVSDEAVRALNSTWRQQDKPTNVLSFPSPRPPAPAPAPGMSAAVAGSAPFLGDVVLALPTVSREAADLGIPPSHHLRHLVLHGLLHLMGYDHEEAAEAARMEALETRILATIGIADPYREPPLAGTDD